MIQAGSASLLIQESLEESVNLESVVAECLNDLGRIFDRLDDVVNFVRSVKSEAQYTDYVGHAGR